MKGDDSAGGDRNLLAGLGVAAGALRFVAQLEVAEAGQLHALPGFERDPDLLEEGLDHVLGFALVEAELLEQHVGQFGFGERHPVSLAASFCAESIREELREVPHGGVHFGICQCASSILHNYPKRKAFSPFDRTFSTVKVEQPDILDERRTTCFQALEEGACGDRFVDHDRKVPDDSRELRDFGVPGQRYRQERVAGELERHCGGGQAELLLPRWMELSEPPDV